MQPLGSGGALKSGAATVTAERIERALDGLAGIIAAAGEAGRTFLPIFARLERDLADMRADDATMAAALARAG